MRNKNFNLLVRNRPEKLIAIAFFLVLGLIFSNVRATTATLSSTLDSGTVASAAPSPTAPVWAKLVVSGNTVSCYYAFSAPAPNLWTQLGTAQTINFINNPILAGIYINAYNNSAVSTGMIDNFSITPTPNYRLADYDIGSPPLMGSANLINGVWNIAGSGFNFYGTSDQCNFQSWLVWGDFTIICRITSISGGNAAQKIGIMVRDGFNSGSDYALFCIKGGGGIDYQYRKSFNNNPDIIQFVAPPLPGVKSGVAVGYGLTGGTSYTLRP